MRAVLNVKAPSTATVSDVQHSLAGLVESETLCTISTVSTAGQPHINCAFYAPVEDWGFTIWTPPESEHAKNFTRSAESALSLAYSRTEWGTEIHGVQLFGKFELANGQAAAQCFSAYTTRFASLLKWAGAIDDINSAFQSRFYVFRPARAKLIDEARFGKEVYVELEVVR